MGLPVVDLWLVISNLTAIAVAFVLALPIGWEREQSERSAGLRTFPLVAMASCGYILIASKVLAGHPEGTARVVEGLMTGIGFIGGGAILKSDGTVRGTATAASVWNTGAVGAAVAFERYEIALVLAAINYAALRWLQKFKAE
ncbi:MAG TPA: MgtC/SapB family protein [Candidatus Tectomicrobia bacterium]|nr:MgtC/SapB family protein [Candidatus Tectomicrobia bacterium]